jgi:chorismate mutase
MSKIKVIQLSEKEETLIDVAIRRYISFAQRSVKHEQDAWEIIDHCNNLLHKLDSCQSIDPTTVSVVIKGAATCDNNISAAAKNTASRLLTEAIKNNQLSPKYQP